MRKLKGGVRDRKVRWGEVVDRDEAMRPAATASTGRWWCAMLVRCRLQGSTAAVPPSGWQLRGWVARARGRRDRRSTAAGLHPLALSLATLLAMHHWPFNPSAQKVLPFLSFPLLPSNSLPSVLLLMPPSPHLSPNLPPPHTHPASTPPLASAVSAPGMAPLLVPLSLSFYRALEQQQQQQAPLQVPAPEAAPAPAPAPVSVWEWSGHALDAGEDAALWFSQFLRQPVRLVRFDTGE